MKNLYLERIVNSGKGFEGGGVLPQPKAGQRVKTVSSLKILKNESIVGGAKVTLGWFDDGSTSDSNTYFEISVYSGINFDLISSSQNINSSDISKLTTLQSITKTKTSPAELFVYTNIAMPVVFAVTLRDSSGVLSSSDFAAFTTAFIRPVMTHIVRTTATAYTMSKVRNMLLLADPTAANITVTLPPISEVPDGFIQRVKHIGTAGTVTLTPNGGTTPKIDNGTSYVITAPLTCIQYEAERLNNKWWIT